MEETDLEKAERVYREELARHNGECVECGAEIFDDDEGDLCRNCAGRDSDKPEKRKKTS